MPKPIRPSLSRIEHLRTSIAELFEDDHVTSSEGTSALASLLCDAFIEEIRNGNPHVAGEMRRMADRLRVLADAHPHEVVALAGRLADA